MSKPDRAPRPSNELQTNRKYLRKYLLVPVVVGLLMTFLWIAGLGNEEDSVVDAIMVGATTAVIAFVFNALTLYLLDIHDRWKKR
jgi:hypothetical protein